MRQSRPLYLILSAAVLIFALTLMTLPNPSTVFAQDVPAADTPTGQPTDPPTPTETVVPTETPVDPATATPEPTATATATQPAAGPPNTAVPTSTPQPPAPVSIPEPITVVLFGTGLAALSAAAARRKNESSKGDE